MSEAAAQMKVLGELNGRKWYWADEQFTRPGLYYWNGETNVLAFDSRGASALSVCQEIAAERLRHFNVFGWNADHDDEHGKGELSAAAANYVVASRLAMALGGSGYDGDTSPPLDGFGAALAWPWAATWWKPGQVRRMLVKAASLIVAEIERLDRSAP